MGATPARIGFVRQEFRRAIAESPAIATRHGALARRDEEPLETFFDDPADAQAIADARQDLLGAERRRFGVTVKGLEEALGLSLASGTVPQANYVDPARGVDRDVLVAEIAFDFASQKASLVVWG